MGNGRVPAALPQFSFQSGDPNSEVIPVPVPISIEESQALLAQQPPHSPPLTTFLPFGAGPNFASAG